MTLLRSFLHLGPNAGTQVNLQRPKEGRRNKHMIWREKNVVFHQLSERQGIPLLTCVEREYMKQP